MNLVDSHTHLFLDDFSEDLPQVMERAEEAGVTHIFMPNIDSSTIASLKRTCSEYRHLCFPMMGLHPTSVDGNYEQELQHIKQELYANRELYVAVGEIGLDLYWDKTYLQEQMAVLQEQLLWALELDLSVVIHCREAFDYIYKVLGPYRETKLKGIFHSFTGDREEAERIMEFSNFLIGINGVVTFKKSTLPDTLKHIPLERLVLETDAPYLTPVPYRGKRNESAYVKNVMLKVAEVYEIPPEEVAKRTSENALKVFGMLK